MTRQLADELSSKPPKVGRGRLAQDIAAAVGGVPGAALTAGPGIPIGTQFRGGTIAGVGFSDGSVFIQIVVTDFAFLRVVENVRKAVRDILQSNGVEWMVHVHIADLDLDIGLAIR